MYRHGRSSSRHERFRCRPCRRVFQLSYTCEAVSPASKNTLLIWPLMVLTCAIQQKR
ncbi:hypothetical protein GTT80_000661 [Salmonella enterica]|uniref:InsA N-terminal zinc ribbon domain-containing protein n=2 Tax=Salmonella enterica TaxID=28901 RepID=A0A8E9Z8R8_SALER|nr:hypothetical protein [Salmonella enterica]EAA9619535.1 hypothetical protein [Salmonella enterica subsp. enterica serovar Meleagridis]EAW2460359.1 hypothetical protein [Salmonella enterica subsp. enterica]EBJ7218923.1 hypothetical protein [Salmonella enterica subsp. enterica serovar 3,10:e,h:-]EDE1791859.1 hypothetical protein [Salmonella enterica subsp. enterica serovar Enteritidis]EDX4534324.1 hypothetical protein [Salmonella enterica subsp. enterica serovar Calabar]EGA4890248.1 hypotheti